ncbi:MAG TPA: TIM barrel protein [Candidatus Dojkabacteria bacterium]|nr:TIM barrel protein [Candidatus Dojkabacteria bacterium]
MEKLLFGTGGSPLTSASRSTQDGIKRIKELGLDCLEMEFVHGVKMSKEVAQDVAKLRKNLGVELTIHGPYYINLASENNKIFYGSIKYITDAMLIGEVSGARSVTFHPGFYQKGSPEETYTKVAKGVAKIYERLQQVLQKENLAGFRPRIKLAPELTGKPTQFGELEELLTLCKQFKKDDLRFCFDFAHKYARSNGKYNTYDEFMKMLEKISKSLGDNFLKSLHMHVSGIMHSEKGERNHVTLLANVSAYRDAGVDLPEAEAILKDLGKKDKLAGSFFNWQELLRALKMSGVGGNLVCESPNLEMDALVMKNYYSSI